MFIHSFMNFRLIDKDKNSNARAGVFKTEHGEIETPIFMPVGTAGTVKAVKQNTKEKHVDFVGQDQHYRYFQDNCPPSNSKLFTRLNFISNFEIFFSVP